MSASDASLRPHPGQEGEGGVDMAELQLLQTAPLLHLHYQAQLTLHTVSLEYLFTKIKVNPEVILHKCIIA